MMLLKNLSLMTLISLLSTFVAETKSTSFKSKEWKHHGQQHLAESSPFSYYRLPIRHHNHVLEKKYKCDWDRFHSKYTPETREKPSRYPTLDKIANRLDNQIDRDSYKSKLTTPDPYNRWEVQISDDVTEKPSKYTYETIPVRNETKLSRKPDKANAKRPNAGKKIFKKGARWKIYDDLNDGGAGDDEEEEEDEDEDDNDAEDDDYIVKGYAGGNDNEGSTPAFTTSHPWGDEQRDVLSQMANTTEKVNASKPSAFSRLFSGEKKEGKEWRNQDQKLSKSPLGKLTPRLRDAEDKKKKVPSTPYVAAHEHYEHVLRLGDCHTPKEKVIKVHEVHPDPSKSYSPSCTILHQCGDDTGCCRDLKQECKPKNTTKVELYFFTTTLGKPQTVEKLYFVNHTECECQKRTNDLMPRDSEYVVGNEEYHRGMSNACVCPSKYSTRRFRNGTCICDCFDKQHDCLMLKKGKNGFSHHDKLCIQQGVCSLPSCEFGSYLKEFGRCPNKRQHYRVRKHWKFLPRHVIT